MYDHPRYYDVGFSWDPTRELDFLEECFSRYGRPHTKSVLELGCGTGRLAIGLAKRGYHVIGIDKSQPMIEYLSDKARRVGVKIQLVKADMADFLISGRVDAAFCALNTFRYLMTEEAALRNLQIVAESLSRGGIYVIDFNLLGSLASYPQASAEEWTANSDNLTVRVAHRVIGVPDLKNRHVLEEISFTVRDEDSVAGIRTQEPMRTYTRDEFEDLVGSGERFETLAWHGPDFNIERKLTPGPETERVVVVLRKV